MLEPTALEPTALERARLLPDVEYRDTFLQKATDRFRQSRHVCDDIKRGSDVYEFIVEKKRAFQKSALRVLQIRRTKSDDGKSVALLTWNSEDGKTCFGGMYVTKKISLPEDLYPVANITLSNESTLKFQSTLRNMIMREMWYDTERDKIEIEKSETRIYLKSNIEIFSHVQNWVKTNVSLGKNAFTVVFFDNEQSNLEVKNIEYFQIFKILKEGKEEEVFYEIEGFTDKARKQPRKLTFKAVNVKDEVVLRKLNQYAELIVLNIMKTGVEDNRTFTEALSSFSKFDSQNGSLGARSHYDSSPVKYWLDSGGFIDEDEKKVLDFNFNQKKNNPKSIQGNETPRLDEGLKNRVLDMTFENRKIFMDNEERLLALFHKKANTQSIFARINLLLEDML